jgi:hypothetical protein
MGSVKTRQFAAAPVPARRSNPTKIPTTIRGSIQLAVDGTIEDDAHRRVAAKLGKHVDLVERVAIVLSDGSDGAAGAICRIEARLTGMSEIIVEEDAPEPALALRRAADALGRTVRRAMRHAGHAPPAPAPKRSREGAPGLVALREDDGSLFDRRVGHASANLERTLDRPEKRRRDSFVDTAAPGVSATDRTAGYGATAARNTRRNTAGMTVALEDSRTRPSRKSTRRATNRVKSATPKQRTTQLAAHAPTVEATRANAQIHGRRG